MDVFSTILILILIVSLSGVVVKLFNVQIPLPLMQIALGSILAAFNLYEEEFEPELFLLLFIPPLLFDDGRKTPLKEFIHNSREIISLALVLVVVTVVLLGFLLHHLLPNVPLPFTMALASVLSPTDAVALGGIVGKGRIAKDKMEILEGEALMNDASGLVSLKFALAIGMGTMSFNFVEISFAFFFTAIGGLVIGACVTWVYILILRKINQLTENDSAIQIVLLFILPFAVYLIAEHLQTSGILAAVSAGMTVRQSGIMRKAPLATRLQSENTWAMLTFVFNGVIFTLLGLQFPKIIKHTIKENNKDLSFAIDMGQLIYIVFYVYAALMTIRFIWIFIMSKAHLKNKRHRRFAFSTYTIRDMLISTVSGVRGAITLAGVLTIPFFYPNTNLPLQFRYELVFIAANVILLSLIVATLLLPILLKGMGGTDKKSTIDEMHKIKGMMAEEAIVSLEKMQANLQQDSGDEIDNELVNEVSARVIGSLRRRTGLKNLEEKAMQSEQIERRMRLVAIGSERAALYKLKAQKQISENAFERLLDDLDIYEKLISDEAI